MISMSSDRLRDRILNLSQASATALGAIFVFLIPFLLLMFWMVWPDLPAYFVGALIVPSVVFGLWTDGLRSIGSTGALKV